MRVLPRLAVLLVLALVVLSACASTDDEPAATPNPPANESTSRPTPEPGEIPEPFRGLPEGAGVGVQSPAGVVIGEDGLVHVVTYGSSSNPAIARSATAQGQEVTVDVSNVPDRPATMDFVPTTSAFLLPEGVDEAQPVTFVLGDLGRVTVDRLETGAEAWVEPRD